MFNWDPNISGLENIVIVIFIKLNIVSDQILYNYYDIH